MSTILRVPRQYFTISTLIVVLLLSTPLFLFPFPGNSSEEEPPAAHESGLFAWPAGADSLFDTADASEGAQTGDAKQKKTKRHSWTVFYKKHVTRASCVFSCSFRFPIIPRAI